MAIPVVLIYFVRRRTDIPFPWVFWLFGAFILGCGTTHLMEMIATVWPAYRLGAVIKVFTAGVSLATVFALIPLTPRALALRSPRDLEKEIERRQQAEKELSTLNSWLEREVKERTRELRLWEQIFRNAGWAVAVLDPFENKILAANHAFARMHGQKVEAMLGQSVDQLLAPETLQDLPVLTESLLLKKDHIYEASHVRANGERFHVLTHATLIHGEDGAFLVRAASFQDITELRNAQANLEAAQERLALAQQAGRLGAFEWNPQTGDYIWTEQLRSLYGHPRNPSSTYQDWVRFLHPEDRSEVEDSMAQAVQQGKPWQREFRILQPNGNLRWLAGRATVLTNESGQPGRMIGVNVDISERKQAEEELRLSETRFRQLADAMPQIVWTAQADGSFDYFNERWYEFTGLPREEDPDVGWQDMLHPDDAPRCQNAWSECVQTGEPFQMEFRLGDPLTAKYRWFLGRAVPAREGKGSIVRWFGTCTDINEKKRTEEELRRREAIFRVLSDSIPQMVWRANPAGEIDYYNQRWFDYTGLSFQDTAGQGWQQVIHPEDREEGVRQWQRAIAGADRHEVEQRLRRHDGLYRWHLVRGLPLRDASGRVLQWVGTITDIDDQRRQTQALEDKVRERTLELTSLNEALHRSNKELEQFAYVASHDLQEPLRKIQAFGDRLAMKYQDKLDSSGEEYIQRMQASAARMQRLINDLLAFSRVSTKVQPFSRIDLDAIAQEVVSDLEERLKETGGRIEMGVLEPVQADPVQMRQLLQNLLGNALKFHKADEPPVVRLEGKILRESPDGNFREPVYQITVQDNGIGFEEIYLDRIFQMFQRLHSRSEYEGTGVGLAICRKIVERHGGTITARSQPEQGSTFIVTLPAPQ